MDFLGPMLSDETATAIAVGDMDPITMEVFPSGKASAFEATPAPAVVPASQQTQLLDPRMFSRLASSRDSKPLASQSTPGKRKFPVSFSSRATAERVKKQPSPSLSRPNDAKVSTTSPCISRFFAPVTKKMSPASELEKKSSSISLESMESYESQEPSEIDVSKSISFKPEEKKTVVLSVNKENRSPVPPTGCLPVKRLVKPVAKETAFARMMRAGSSGKNVGGIKRNPLPTVTNRSVLTKKLRTLEFKPEAPRLYSNESGIGDSVASVKSSQPEGEAEPLGKSQDDGKPNDEDMEDPMPKEPAISAKVPAASGSFFDRFRFKA